MKTTFTLVSRMLKHATFEKRLKIAFGHTAQAPRYTYYGAELIEFVYIYSLFKLR